MTKAISPDDFLGVGVQTCAMCGEGQAKRLSVVQEFAYGSGQDAVVLHAHVPIWSCETCDLEYVDAEGERAQHNAVCRHLGRLTPSEIKALRTGARLTQQQFAERLGCGIASLKRWELGTVIQGRVSDIAIRDFVRERKRANPPAPVFRTSLSAAQLAAAPRFRLRECYATMASAA